MKMTIETIAKICHAANSELCYIQGDCSQLLWDDAPEWQKTSAIKGVQYRIDNPADSPEDQHKAWMKDKIIDGWKYGKIKDAEKKEHPCLVPYLELPEDQRYKDYLFIGIVDSLKDFLQ